MWVSIHILCLDLLSCLTWEKTCSWLLACEHRENLHEQKVTSLSKQLASALLFCISKTNPAKCLENLTNAIQLLVLGVNPDSFLLVVPSVQTLYMFGMLPRVMHSQCRQHLSKKFFRVFCVRFLLLAAETTDSNCSERTLTDWSQRLCVSANE